MPEIRIDTSVKSKEQIYGEILAVVQKSTVKDTTKKQYIRAVERMRKANIDPTNPDELNAYMETLKESPRKFLHAAINIWTNSFYKPNSPQDNIKGKTTPTESYTWLTKENAHRLISSLKVSKPSDQSNSQKQIEYLYKLQKQVILGLLMGVGLRREEAEELIWDSIKRDTNSIDVYRNGVKHRSVPVSNGLTALLDEWGIAIGTRKGRILRSINEDGSIEPTMSGTSIAKVVVDCGKGQGMDLTPETLRRGFAQLALQQGHSLYQISKWLGHRNVRETIRYLEANASIDISVCDVLERKGT